MARLGLLGSYFSYKITGYINDQILFLKKCQNKNLNRNQNIFGCIRTNEALILQLKAYHFCSFSRFFPKWHIKMSQVSSSSVVPTANLCFNINKKRETDSTRLIQPDFRSYQKIPKKMFPNENSLKIRFNIVQCILGNLERI